MGWGPGHNSLLTIEAGLGWGLAHLPPHPTSVHWARMGSGHILFFSMGWVRLLSPAGLLGPACHCPRSQMMPTHSLDSEYQLDLTNTWTGHCQSCLPNKKIGHHCSRHLPSIPQLPGNLNVTMYGLLELHLAIY